MGKFRPWLLIGTLTNATFLCFMFAAPPTLDGNGMIAYAAIVYILWGVTYTMMDIPYWSMIPAFTRGGAEREGLSTLARSCAGVGSALITVVTMLLVPRLGKLGNGAKRLQEMRKVTENSAVEIVGFRYFTLIIAVLFVLFLVITCLAIKEKSTVDMESPSVREMFRALFSNDQAVTTVITIVLINSSLYITSNLLIYFFKYDIAGANWNDNFVMFSTFGGAIQILSMMIFYPLLRKRFSSLKIFYFSFVLAILGYCILLGMVYLGTGRVEILLFPGFLIFAAFGMLTVLTTVFLANTVDYGELKNHRRDESVIFSMQTFVVKMASGVAAFLASICLSVCKISSDTTEVIDETTAMVSNTQGLRLTMTVLPIIGLCFGVFVFSKNYKLTDEKLKKIEEELRKRK